MDLEKLFAETWTPRTMDVQCPAEIAGHEHGGKSITVRQPTANELAISAEEMLNRKRWSGLVDALESADKEEITRAVREAMGKDGDPRPDFARRISLLHQCTEPPIEESYCLQLSIHFPVFFQELTNVIFNLAALGSETKKKRTDSIDKAK